LELKVILSEAKDLAQRKGFFTSLGMAVSDRDDSNNFSDRLPADSAQAAKIVSPGRR
jgi:hypothetical protein